MKTFTIRVNGQEHSIEALANMPLLWVLRDILKLTGTKYGCGIGQCGACTVHLDGEPIRSCSLPISQVGNRAIQTIEGISKEFLHPVQKAWIDEQVPQCGYCQTGQIMSAIALLEANPDPTELEIESFMSGNICRCGTYPRIKRAIRELANQNNN